ncbi:cuticle protein 16.5-like [Neocloeon triangulifer]|uniref:cuticle protein 16.5-like n=1 Tax=Neocloeon triangulifer TaxID=2078957 RepID=UPI00286F587A|nr:cuticle protein 16.5-like [Neocloeon triangulifer]
MKTVFVIAACLLAVAVAAPADREKRGYAVAAAPAVYHAAPLAAPAYYHAPAPAVYHAPVAPVAYHPPAVAYAAPAVHAPVAYHAPAMGYPLGYSAYTLH